jgi:DNA-binding response OmpR family regulator
LGQNIKKSLESQNIEVNLVSDSNEAVKNIYDFLPNLIIMDVDLSQKKSGEILKEKMSDSFIAKIPVFLLSTQGTAINMNDIPKGSVTEFVMSVHPDTDEIVNKVSTYLNTKSTDVEKKSKFKILWVEDDKLIGSILYRKLTSSGFEVVHKTNGPEALIELENFMPDAIIVDLLLPQMSGFDILQHIAMNESFRKVPKMVLSNLSKESDKEKAKLLGAKKFMVKASSSLDQIVEEIRNLCEGK